MIDNDKLTEAYNEFEKLRKVAEEKDYKFGWIFYRLKEKFGVDIAREVMPRNRDDLDEWDGDVAD